MKDAIGNEIKVGDRVATDVMKKNGSALRVGHITGSRQEPYGLFVKITYDVAPRWRYGSEQKKMLRRGVWRTPDGVVKVADGVQG